jgi:hypothetical protein
MKSEKEGAFKRETYVIINDHIAKILASRPSESDN